VGFENDSKVRAKWGESIEALAGAMGAVGDEYGKGQKKERAATKIELRNKGNKNDPSACQQRAREERREKRGEGAQKKRYSGKRASDA